MASMIKPAPKSFHGKTIPKSSGKDASAGAAKNTTGMGKKSSVKTPSKKSK